LVHVLSAQKNLNILHHKKLANIVLLNAKEMKNKKFTLGNGLKEKLKAELEVIMSLDISGDIC